LVAEARALIGVPWRRCQYNHPVSRPAINRWAKSIGDHNPLWLHPDYPPSNGMLQYPRTGQTLAPPGWLYSVDDTCIAPKLLGIHVIYAGTDWEL
jgi:hypothetical protein